MRIGDVLETSLYAEDLQAAEAFYREVLGLEVAVRAPGRHVFFRCGAGMLLLFNPNATRLRGGLPAHGAAGPVHIAFGVPQRELGDWRKRLLSRGIPIEHETVWPNGTMSIYFRDPAGNSLELTSPRLWNLAESPGK